MYSTRPGTCTVPAKVTVTSPTATGTVFRSTTTRPRCASTMRPGPWELRSVIPDTEYGMSNVTMASEGASAFSRGSLKCGNTVELTGTGLGWGPAGGCLASHQPGAAVRPPQAPGGRHR